MDLTSFSDLFKTVTGTIYSLLPNSPFRQFIYAMEEIPYLKNLNWFLPVSEIIAIMQIWLTAVALYYTYSAILRLVRIIT